MHDIKAIRMNPQFLDAAMTRRGLGPQSESILQLDTERRAAMTAQQEAQSRRNVLAKEIGAAKRSGADSSALAAEATTLRDTMERLGSDAEALDAELNSMLARLPNALDADVPDGNDESANVEVKTGAHRPNSTLRQNSISSWARRSA